VLKKGEVEEERNMVSKREVVPEDERASESGLHCEINDLVQEHLEGRGGLSTPRVPARRRDPGWCPGAAFGPLHQYSLS
jgi:hypothetical protein